MLLRACARTVGTLARTGALAMTTDSATRAATPAAASAVSSDGGPVPASAIAAASVQAEQPAAAVVPAAVEETVATEGNETDAKVVGSRPWAENSNKPKKNKAKKPSRRDLDALANDNLWPRPYLIEDYLRRVEPYHYTYTTHYKARWHNTELIKVFGSEFRDRPEEYYRGSIERGDIRINGRAVKEDYILCNGDVITHKLHRHEAPVTAEPIGIIHEDDDMIVINKPSGVPVHPAGRYNFNSVTEIMRAERGRDFLPRPCNRLDRLTSGIMFIAKSVKAAKAMTMKIMERSVRKEYLARVVGHFPDGEVVCDQPILQIAPKLGLNRIRANGQPARTVFKRLAYYPPHDGDAEEPAVLAEDGKPLTPADGDILDDERSKSWLKKRGYSIVRCLPVTGRTHQLRVHLQYLGHPIQNDPIYANRRVWGFNLGQADADGSLNADEDIISRLNRMGKEEVAEAVVYYDKMVDEYEEQRAEKLTGETCEICATPLYSDPGSHELSIWLHSLRYEDADGSWSYTTPLPKWALPPEGTSGPTTVGGTEELVEAVKDENPEISSDFQAKAGAEAEAKAHQTEPNGGNDS